VEKMKISNKTNCFSTVNQF